MHAIPRCNYRTTNGVVFSILVYFMCMLYVYPYICWIGLCVHEQKVVKNRQKSFQTFQPRTNYQMNVQSNMKKNVIFQWGNKGYRLWLNCVSAFRTSFQLIFLKAEYFENGACNHPIKKLVNFSFLEQMMKHWHKQKYVLSSVLKYKIITRLSDGSSSIIVCHQISYHFWGYLTRVRRLEKTNYEKELMFFYLDFLAVFPTYFQL